MFEIATCNAQTNENANDIQNQNEEISTCDMYMADSIIPGAGRGIYAARKYQQNELLEESPSLTLRDEYATSWSLNNYVFASQTQGRSLVVFGLAMLYNHQSPIHKNAVNAWNDDEVQFFDVEVEPHSTSTQLMYLTNQVIEPGHEIFTTYGGELWFKERGVSYKENTNASDVFYLPVSYLQEHGYCMTNVFTGPSNIPMAGKGLFAKKSFKKGETIYVSPVLILLKSDVYEASLDTVILNYCISSARNTGILIFPIGLTAIVNHQSSERANMEYRWLNSDIVNKDPSELFSSSYAPLDLEYIATRDIYAGEELTMNYGDAWINAWAEYLAIRLMNLMGNSTEEVLFRHAIQDVNGLFPENWNDVTCIGSNCNANSNINNENVNGENIDNIHVEL